MTREIDSDIEDEEVWGSWNLEPPYHGNNRRQSSVAAAIPLRWWRMMTRSKAIDPAHQFAWSAADQTDQRRRNGQPAGAIESALRFDGANKITAKTKV